MPAVQRVLIGALSLLAVMLIPAAARAHTLHADFDGDGLGDRVDISAPFTEVDVRLSGYRKLQRLRSADLIFHIDLADVDRDGDPDVVATTRGAGLEIWINTGRDFLEARASRAPGLAHGAPAAVDSASCHRADDSAFSDDQTREVIAASSPRGHPRLSACRTADAPRARESRFQHSPRTARGPPFASLL